MYVCMYVCYYICAYIYIYMYKMRGSGSNRFLGPSCLHFGLGFGLYRV